MGFFDKWGQREGRWRRRVPATGVLLALAATGSHGEVSAATPKGAAVKATPASAVTLPDGWEVTPEGAVVIDRAARVAWSRCVEGMRWNGQHCAGKPLLLDRAAAAARAAERAIAEGEPWRLPRVPELQRLVDRTRTPPGLDPVLFPGAPGHWHWSSTSNAGARRDNPYDYNTVMANRQGNGTAQMRAINGWAVDLSSGAARGDAARGSLLPVRLVRSVTAEEAGR